MAPLSAADADVQRPLKASKNRNDAFLQLVENEQYHYRITTEFSRSCSSVGGGSATYRNSNSDQENILERPLPSQPRCLIDRWLLGNDVLRHYSDARLQLLWQLNTSRPFIWPWSHLRLQWSCPHRYFEGLKMHSGERKSNVLSLCP